VDTFLSKLVDLLKASPRVWAALTIAGLCVVIPSRWQHLFGLDEFRAHYLPWFTLATVIFAFLLLMAIYDEAAEAIRARRELNRRTVAEMEAEAEVRKRFESLVLALKPEERLILAIFVATGQQTVDLSMLDDDVDRLVQRGMLTKFAQIPSGFRIAHAIDPRLFAFLDKNRSLIGAEWREVERRSAAGEPLH
jgi:hypothetical protein